MTDTATNTEATTEENAAMAAFEPDTPIKILLVDDNPDNLTALQAMLDGEDYELVTARSGQEALRHLLKDEFAVVLLDVVMPGMDGFEVAGLIRQREATRHLPLLFLTALATDVHHIYKGYAVGAVDYLQKPLDANMVRAKVMTFVELHRKNLQIREHAAHLMELERTQAQLREAQLLAEQEHMQLAYEQAAHAETVAAERRAIFLADVSRLLTSSLDREALLPEVIRFIVRELGDWALLDLLGDDGFVPEVAVHRDDEGQQRLAGLQRDLSGLPDAWPGLAEVLQEKTAVGGPISAAELAEQIGTADVETVEALGARARLCMPLVIQDRVLGILTLVSGDPERQYGVAEMMVATDLSHRLAMALHNVMLFQQTQEAVQARDDFMSIASHELKTPLTTLSLQIHMLKRMTDRASDSGDPLPVQSMAKRMREMERQNHRLCMLIERLLDLTRLDSNGLELARGPVQLHDLIEEAVERIGPPVSLETCMPIVGNWDRLRVEQVVTNLLSNAVKYGNGQPVTVSLREIEGCAVLSVRDRGIGVAPELQAHIFERFGRAVSEREFGGIGLGLYISRQIVEAHGGRIEVDSVPGEGATFTVTVPIEAVG